MLMIKINAAALFVFGASLVAIGLNFLMNPPYINTEYRRSSVEPITIQAQWVAWSCGYEGRITEILDSTGKLAIGPLNIRVPKGGENPELSDAASSLNNFVLTGYKYKLRHSNIISGEIIEEDSLRFDVIAWHVLIPYNKINIKGELISIPTPLMWHGFKLDLSANNFWGLKENVVEC